MRIEGAVAGGSTPHHHHIYTTTAYSVVCSLPCAVSSEAVGILGKHMATTKPLVWLCDELVTAFAFLLIMRDIRKCKESPDRRRIHIFEFPFMWSIQGGSGASIYEFGDYTFRPRRMLSTWQ